MNDFNFDQFSQGFEFGGFSAQAEELSGPYLPEARDCMSCGICLGGCPTYRVRQEEVYGPRGRVRLIEKLLKKDEALDGEELEALHACTLCRACETVCPSKMDYSALYSQAMEALAVRPQQTAVVKLLELLAARRSLQRLLRVVIPWYQRSGMQRLLKLIPPLRLKGEFAQLDRLLPVPYVSQAVPPFTQGETAECRGEVALFSGCVSNLFDTQTHNATIKLLTQLGHDVRVLEKQGCCGAIYAHSGELERARGCARQNIDAFTQGGSSQLIYNSSGCGAFLSEYPELLKEDHEGGEPEPSLTAIDIMDFLAQRFRPGELQFKELRAKVAVHEPCSQRNVLQNHEVVYELLANIPGLEVSPLADNKICCGAGGTKMITQPALANPPRDEKVAALLQSGAELLVTTNLSCALHLASGVREAGREIEVVHPVQLLARQLA